MITLSSSRILLAELPKWDFSTKIPPEQVAPGAQKTILSTPATGFSPNLPSQRSLWLDVLSQSSSQSYSRTLKFIKDSSNIFLSPWKKRQSTEGIYYQPTVFACRAGDNCSQSFFLYAIFSFLRGIFSAAEQKPLVIMTLIILIFKGKLHHLSQWRHVFK